MLTKICGKCGARYAGTFCPRCEAKRQKNYDRTERNKDRASFYNSPAWQRLTKQCKAESFGIDLYALHTTGRIVMGRLSHHIIPVGDDRGRAYDLGNLLWVSDASHAVIHRAYDASDEEKEKMQTLLFSLKREGVRGREGKKVCAP